MKAREVVLARRPRRTADRRLLRHHRPAGSRPAGRLPADALGRDQRRSLDDPPPDGRYLRAGVPARSGHRGARRGAGGAECRRRLGGGRLWLHALGVPGPTAYVGLVQVAQVQPGETVWVSAATGAVGSVAAQLARARGAGLVIGSTGGADKARYLTQTLGLDAAVDYRAGHLREQLRRAAPDGIHVYFDNVGGDHLEAALDVMRIGGRIAACGMISGYGMRQPGPPNLAEIIVKRLRVEGFLVLDHLDRRAEFEAEVGPLLEAGRLHADVTIFEGIDSAPAALASLLDGTKIGKALIRP